MAGSRVFSVIHAPRPTELSGLAYVLALHIADKHDTSKHCAWLSRKDIAKLMSISERYARELIAELEKVGYLRVYERARAWSRYVLLPFPGEIVPGDIVIPDGHVLRDKETGLDWELRSPYMTGEDQRFRAEIKKRQRDALQFAEEMERNSRKKGQGRR